MRKVLFSALVLMAAGTAGAQTVTVDATDGSPDNITTFNSLMAAIHSFQASGLANVNGGTTTDGAGLGVNHGNPAPNVINIVNTAPISELVRVTELSTVVPTVQDEPLTINGPGAVANGGIAVAASASNNAVVQPWGEVATATEDLFVIATDVDLTINNVTFCPPVPGGSVVNAGDDVLFIRRASAGGPTNFTFNSCVMTVNQAGGLPWVSSKAEALQDFATLPAVTTLAAHVDDGVTIQQGSDESINVTFRDCVISGMRPLGGARDGFVLFEGSGTYNALYNLVLESTIITHMSRHAIQIAAGATSPANPPSNVLYHITGSDLQGGPLTPSGLGGPSVIALNGFGIAGARAIVDLSGVANRKVVQIDNTIVADNTERQISLNARTQLTLENMKIRGPVPFVYTHDAESVDKTWRGVTAQRVGGGSLLGDVGNGSVLTILDSVFLGPAATPAIGGFGGANMLAHVDHSAWAATGPHAVTALAPGALTGLTTGPNVFGLDPNILNEDFRTAGFLDTNNAQEPPNGLAGLREDGGNLGGGAEFVPTYPAGTTFPQTLTLEDVTLRTTASTSLPFTWSVERIDADPNGLGGSTFAFEHYDEAYWDISHTLGTNDVTADVTLRWPEASGFPADPGNLPNVRIHKPAGIAWLPLNTTVLDVVSDPRTVTSLDVDDFSPFAIALNGDPLYVTLVSLEARQVGSSVVVSWETASEIDNVGFHVHSATGLTPGARLNPFLIGAAGGVGFGASYSFTDPRPIGSLETSRSYFLVDVEANGLATTLHGPVSAAITPAGQSTVSDWAIYGR